MTPAIKYILVGLDLISQNPNRIVASDPKLGIAVVRIDHEMEEMAISKLAHLNGRCGGYEVLPELNASSKSLSLDAQNILQSLSKQVKKNEPSLVSGIKLNENAQITQALQEVSPENIHKTIAWFSGFNTRYNRSSQANVPVNALADKLKEMVASRSNAEVSLIDHQNTPQKSVRVRLPGTTRPQEVIVMGGHLDSIVGMFGSADKPAPGADDNASGTAALTEALRILVNQAPLERTVEFMFYAGEESGLLGSAEIAKDYKAKKVDVVSVLQLDMTSFPGSGKFVMASMNDFTSPTLRQYLVELNRLYIGNTIVDDKCGYGCSDHASWFRQGFPTVMPTEAKFSQMFRDLHTPRDVINNGTNFEHAASFAKVALSMAMDIGNSTQRF